MGNETYKIIVGSPLLRPRLKVEVDGVSERYLVPTMKGLLDYVRDFNLEQKEILKKSGKLETKTR